MSILKKFFARKQPTQRIHICVECGVEVPEHKDWCSILRHMLREGDAQSGAAVGEDS